MGTHVYLYVQSLSHMGEEIAQVSVQMGFFFIKEKEGEENANGYIIIIILVKNTLWYN